MTPKSKPPERSSSSRETRVREHVKYVQGALRQAASGDEEKMALLRDGNTADMIVAVTEQTAGKNVQYLPPALQETAPDWHPAYVDAAANIETLKTRAEKTVANLIEQFGALKQQVEDSQKNHKDIKALQDAEQILAGSVLSQIDLTKKLDSLLNRAKQITETGGADVEAKLKALGDEARLLFHPDGTKATDLTAQRATITKARKQIRARLAELEKDESIVFINGFKGRARYLDRLGASDADVLVRNSILRTNGQFDMTQLTQNLEVLRNVKLPAAEAEEIKKLVGLESAATVPDSDRLKELATRYDVTEAKVKEWLFTLLTKGQSELADDELTEAKTKIPSLTLDDLKEGLLSAWDTAAAAKYLKDNLGVNNPPGISLSQLSFRARLPESVAAVFAEIPDDDSKLKAVRDKLGAGHLIALAQVDELVEGVTLSDNAAGVLVEMLVKENSVINEQEFKAVATYLFLEKVPAGKKIEDQWRAAAATAVELWDELVKDGVINPPVGGQFTVVDDFKTKLKTAITPGTLAVEHCKEMNARNIHEIKWKQKAGMLLSEMGEVMKEGGGIWLDYIKELPKIIWAPGMDKKLEDIMKEQKALAQSDEALDAYSKTLLTFNKFVTEAFKQMKADESSKADALKPIGIATDVKKHVESAGLLLNASVQAVERLNAAHQWSSRPIAIRRVAFWLAMYKGAKGLERAGTFLTESAASAKDPDVFIAEYIKDLPPKDRESLLAYLRRLNTAEELSDRNVLDEVSNSGITVRADALKALDSQNLTTSFDRLFIDEPANAEPALRVILVASPGAEALIKAFLTKTEQSYEFQGQKRTINAEDAKTLITKIQKDLNKKRRGVPDTQKQLEKEELFTNPLERVLRGGIETLKELWDGDGVDKAQAVAAVVAAIWLMRAMWQKKGLSRGILIGLPLIMVANTIYKKKTGKDFLGEKLSFMSKEKRGTAVEGFRRRAGRFERYDVLNHNAGHAAMKQLLSSSNPIPVEELMKWRKSVKSKGGVDYSNGAPKGLQVYSILSHMGSDQQKPEDAHEVAFLVFESLCVDVAALNNVGGDVDSMAEHGADIIQRRYVERDEYGDAERDKAFGKGKKRTGVTMLDVMISESQTPASQEAIAEDRAFVEWLADSVGLSAAVVVSKMKQGWTVLEIKAEQIAEKMPEYWETGKGFVLDSAESVSAWAKLTWRKLGTEVPKDFDASMSFVLDTCKGIGIAVVTHGPGAVEFVMDKGTKFSWRTYRELKRLHDRMLIQPEMRMFLEPLENTVARVFGIELGGLSVEQATAQATVDIVAMASFYDGGNYPSYDVRIPEGTVSTFEHYKRSSKIDFVDASGKEFSVQEMKTKIEGWANEVIPKLDFDGEYKSKSYSELPPALQRYVLELIQANIFANIVQNSEFEKKMTEFETDKEDKEKDVTDADAEEDRIKLEKETLETDFEEMDKLNKKHAAAEAEKDELVAQHSRATLSKDKTALMAKITAKLTEMQDINADLSDYTNKYTSLANLETEINTKNTEYNAAVETLQEAEEALDTLVKAGISVVKINLDLDVEFAAVPAAPVASKLYLDIDMLTPKSGNRGSDLFDKGAAFQQRKLLFVPFNWLLGDAEYAALEGGVQSWLADRLQYDNAYVELQRKPVKTPEEVEMLSSYERYIRHVATSEVFLRVMMESPGTPSGESQNPLHLSLHEARRIQQYLEEKEGLVTFDKYQKDVYKAFNSARRP